jgi:hypothetical protein
MATGGGSVQIDLLRMIDELGVVVGRRPKQNDLSTRREIHAIQGGVSGDPAVMATEWGVRAARLFHELGH